MEVLESNRAIGKPYNGKKKKPEFCWKYLTECEEDREMITKR